MQRTHLVVLLALIGILFSLILSLPYSLVPLAGGLVSGGIAAWRLGKVTWVRALGIGATFGGILLTIVVLVIGFMLFSGRLVKETVSLNTPIPIQSKIFVDNRSPKQKTLIPDRNLQCTPNPAGLAFTAQVKLQNTVPTNAISETIQLEGDGFVPDETLNIFLKGGSQNGLYSLAFNEQVRADGTFSRIEHVEWDSPQTEWQAFVVHQRGTTCVQFLGN